MAFTFPFLKSAFTSLGGANVDVVVLRAAIINGGIIVQDLLPQPEGIKWINELPIPTIQFSFVTDLPAPEETELNSIVAAHTGPSDTSQGVRLFFETTPPLVTDDSDKLFEVGDIWRDGEHSYLLTDATVGAAVWQWISGWGSARPTTLVKLRADLQTGGEAAPCGLLIGKLQSPRVCGRIGGKLKLRPNVEHIAPVNAQRGHSQQYRN